MDPTGAGYPRGFRAPGSDQRGFRAPAAGPERPGAQADSGAQAESADPAAPGADAELLVAGPPDRRRRLPGRRRPGSKARAGNGWRWAIAIASVLVVAVAIIAWLAFRLGAGSAATAGRSAVTQTPTPAASATPLAVPDLYQRAAPSVVLITTSKGSLGSGMIVTDIGTVLTANHVISGGGSITITFADGTRAAATVASADPKTDTATLTPKKLPQVVVPATLGGGAVVGDEVVAIGNPLGLRASTTTGVVSGLSREARVRDAGTLSGLIQFDAAVNPGSSGGPLLDSQGVVIGVVVAIADPGRDDAFAGIGFAVPIGAALGGGDGKGPGGGPQL